MKEIYELTVKEIAMGNHFKTWDGILCNTCIKYDVCVDGYRIHLGNDKDDCEKWVWDKNVEKFISLNDSADYDDIIKYQESLRKITTISETERTDKIARGNDALIIKRNESLLD